MGVVYHSGVDDCTFYSKNIQEFFFSEQLLIGPSLFESCLSQLFTGGFYMGEKSLLYSVELKQSVEIYISQ